MTHPALAAQWRQADPTQLAALSFLARYRGDTLRAYKQDLRAFLGWCAEHDVEPLQALRPHLELYLRWMEQRRLAPATIGRRFTTVAGFYRYAVIDGLRMTSPSGPTVMA
jgi:integrase/recombinase XerD